MKKPIKSSKTQTSLYLQGSPKLRVQGYYDHMRIHAGKPRTAAPSSVGEFKLHRYFSNRDVFPCSAT